MFKQLYHPLIILSCIFLLLTGCGQGENQRAFVNPPDIDAEISQSLADRMERELLKMEEVDKVRAVSLDDEVFIFLNVSGFHRFFLKSIRIDAFEKAKKLNKDAKIHISTDQKINLELADIEKDLQNSSLTKEELKKDLKKIEDDMKG